ncbi:hypothetical protein [Micromonospora sp. NPDC000442]|uniref:hypothetical protein n=1 Tax=Micromonospora sp. NPDC000442 TaxID=3364217 RepID=UPI00368B178B
MGKTGEPVVPNGPTMAQLRRVAVKAMKKLGDVIEPETMVGGPTIFGVVAEKWPEADFAALASDVVLASQWALEDWNEAEERRIRVLRFIQAAQRCFDKEPAPELVLRLAAMLELNHRLNEGLDIGDGQEAYRAVRREVKAVHRGGNPFLLVP